MLEADHHILHQAVRDWRWRVRCIGLAILCDDPVDYLVTRDGQDMVFGHGRLGVALVRDLVVSNVTLVRVNDRQDFFYLKIVSF